jgi:hypothetical protein
MQQPKTNQQTHFNIYYVFYYYLQCYHHVEHRE